MMMMISFPVLKRFVASYRWQQRIWMFARRWNGLLKNIQEAVIRLVDIGTIKRLPPLNRWQGK